jgi:hypothetical protein
MVLHAKRLKDNVIVCIKRIEQRQEEANIARFLTTDELLQDPQNHCVPFWGHFGDPILPGVEYILMLPLR